MDSFPPSDSSVASPSPSPSPSLRLFVALGIPVELREALVRVRDEWPADLGREAVAWTRPESLHLTLRFLGDVAASDLVALEENLARAAAGFGSLPLVCEGLGCFPNARSPRVLWAGVRDEPELGRLNDLSRRITASTGAFTRQPIETRFAGHITLARFRQWRRAAASVLDEVLERSAGNVLGRWTAHEVELIRSELTPGGSRYTVLRRVGLN